MRVALVSTYYRPIIGGAETSTERLAVFLAQKGFHVEVITRHPAADVPRRETIDGVGVRRLPPTGRRRAAGKWIWLPWLFAALMQEPCDVICVSDPRGSAIAAWIASRLRGRPLLIQPHTEGALSGSHPAKTGLAAALHRWATWPARVIYARADAVAGVTRAMLDEARSMGMAEARLHYLPNPFDASLFAPAGDAARRSLRESFGWEPHETVFLFTGRLSIEKGLRELLTAWRDVARPGWRLVLAGPSMPGHAWDLGAWIESFVQTHGLSASVSLLGACGRSELARRMAAADAAVQPSHFEAQGLAAVEAMGCGLPIVATNVGGHREFITEGANGLLVPPHDVRALGTALEQMAGLLADPERRRELRAAARAAVLPFDQDTVLDRFAQVLEDLTSVAARRSATVGQGT
jgi:glycosyltransferase involved in cell wall biosynthesis